MKKIRIGSGAGYAGDRIEPAVELMEKGNLDYIIFECLAERTVAIGQQDKEKDPSKGYNQLLDYRMEKILPLMAKNKVKVSTKLGAANPVSAAERTWKPGAGRLYIDPFCRIQCHGVYDGRGIQPGDCRFVWNLVFLCADKFRRLSGYGAQLYGGFERNRLRCGDGRGKYPCSLRNQ